MQKSFCDQYGEEVARKGVNNRPFGSEVYIDAIWQDLCLTCITSFEDWWKKK